MKYLVDGKEMKLLDQNTTEYFGVPTVVLMEQAAMVFVQKLLEEVQKINKVLVVCGTGNNGADGIGIARLLNQRGIPTSIYLTEENASIHSEVGSELYRLQKKIYMTYGYEVLSNITSCEEYDVIIEALFGIGLSRDIEGMNRKLIAQLNTCGGYKVAVDMPAGISTDTGRILGIAFKADATITFSFGKIGHFLWPGTDYCGKVIVADMGITLDSMLNNKPHVKVAELSELSKIGKRKAHSNKGSYGKVLIVAGSVNMAGAAMLSAKAAYRCGSGLVRVFTREENRVILQSTLPEAILSTYEGNWTLDLQNLEECVRWADAIVVGPGLGRDEVAHYIVDYLLKVTDKPMVVDADALNTIAENPGRYLKNGGNKVITPHLGEMARLKSCSVPDIQENLLSVATEISNQYGVTCVLKDFHTVTACWDGDCYINIAGNNGMATAGSGDVLSGIIGALLAQKATLKQAAAYGVLLHGLAGDCMVQHTGTHAMMAKDLIDGIKMVWKQVEENEDK